MKTPKILVLFFDGVGVGNKDESRNPFYASNIPAVEKLLDGNIPHLQLKSCFSDSTFYSPINATLGIEGLPQSGTGQTALLCGMNAPKFVGKHFGPYPYSTLRNILEKKNIYKLLHQKRKNIFYVNAYPPRYFEYVATHPTRRTATTLAWEMMGYKLNDFKRLQAGEALSADITGEKWNALGFPVIPILSPPKAGHRLVKFLEKYDFVFYEYFYTDHAGHSQSMEKAKNEMTKIDELLSGVIEAFDKKQLTMIITSDHGNFEDLSVKTHTRNPVPFIVYGKEAAHFAGKLKSIANVAPAIVSLY